MRFGNDGTYKASDRPPQPKGWRSRNWLVLHHMIDWGTLRRVWNAVVRSKSDVWLTRYLRIVGMPDATMISRITQQIRAGKAETLGPLVADTLAECLCWQRFNLFEGPTAEQRPGHAPDPSRMLHEFAEASPFDFPIVAPPHGQRASLLWAAWNRLNRFLESGREWELENAFRHLGDVQELDIIRAWDVNWFALPKSLFWTMSPHSRQVFFDTCMARNGWKTAGESVYRELFG